MTAWDIFFREKVTTMIESTDELVDIGGQILIYVPFLYYYHASEGYYGDYWRFTIDTLQRFAEPFFKHEIVPVRLPLETLTRLTPLGRKNFFINVARWLDSRFYKHKNSKQVAGYYLWLQK